jgi:hypothetical protein
LKLIQHFGSQSIAFVRDIPVEGNGLAVEVLDLFQILLASAE